VPDGAVAVWWFGQNGYIFKSPAGILVGIDLYLTNSVPELLPKLVINAHRMQPVFLRPEEVDVDIFACTHSHFDHADPLTIRNLPKKDSVLFVGPYLTCLKMHEYGVPESQTTCLAVEQEMQHGDVKIRGAYAVPTDAGDLNHLGFLLTFGDRVRIYNTGDTDHSELLGAVARHSPQVLITCINGNFNNLSHWEAAELAKWIEPRIAIPCHYDMFPDNAMDPAQFRASLKIRAPGVEYRELPHAEAQLFTF
jgi:L-ascorbate 6-phosphate lactonase